MGKNTEGQSSVLDATLYLAIILVASSLLLSLSQSVSKITDVSSFEDMSTYARRLAHAGLGSTVPEASYVDVSGDEMVHKDISVQDIVITELLLLRGGTPADSFEGPGRFNREIERVFSYLVNESPYWYSLTGNYQDVDILISNSNPAEEEMKQGVEKATYFSEILLPDEYGIISISVHVWRK